MPRIWKITGLGVGLELPQPSYLTLSRACILIF
jgi:hypothetical protein